MADIFISYSKADRDLVVRLAAMLEAEGWSVWWDSSLKPADTYRDEIMRELANARAVISVWTENSVKSDWVRAEAGRAKADGKLIPVKVSGLEYKDIPLPFGEMHTENVGSEELIRFAIESQLKKPQREPARFARATAIVKYETLTWIGIIGGAVTLFSGLRSLIDLSRWVEFLVENWADLVEGIWATIFEWIRIDIDRRWAHFITFIVFCVLFVLGSRGSAYAGKNDAAGRGKPLVGIIVEKPWRFWPLAIFLAVTSVFLAFLIAGLGVVAWVAFGEIDWSTALDDSAPTRRDAYERALIFIATLVAILVYCRYFVQRYGNDGAPVVVLGLLWLPIFYISTLGKDPIGH
ncbi:MAG: toll/interleukin-1 receptor domain-containing protein [Hyphomicrobium sp.]